MLKFAHSLKKPSTKTSLPTDFPENVVTAVETNVLRLHGRLSREYGSK
ncbi:phosphatidylinositol kinase [Shigella sonnei]|nr:phosphatidylinositol kinase [Escherichia coli]EFP5819411.1 type II toxin-antitoxin system HipA family toxin [Shigella sonnei]EFP6020334.1 type II toxin-antitoxin system HipA family toxin [Shigella sonnei]EFP6992515.1 type II toxin-antitoxin system HipA family toxin [Shigella sonnei]EFP7140084.1 type II toxin-antitoxin system HipA family toxin [Shigella sonnei]